MSFVFKAKLSSFPVTRWTLIRQVQSGSESEAAQAMEEICRRYWYPIYGFARHRGFGTEDAEDLTQEFFRRLITGEMILAARQERGLMRTFMLSLLKKVIFDHVRHITAKKRGGSLAATISFDGMEAEERYANEPFHGSEAELFFDHAWARGVLESAEERLREDFAKGNNLDGYAQLREYLPLGENATPYVQAASKLKLSESAFRQQIHRVRKRYAKLIEQEISKTVSDPQQVKSELAHLMGIIGTRG